MAVKTYVSWEPCKLLQQQFIYLLDKQIAAWIFV